MGKRSNFERVERDFYPTPMAAVEPLLIHLRIGSSFCEPCAGAGDLVEHLEDWGHEAGFMCDIEPLFSRAAIGSALDLSEDELENTDYIITNPPWDRKILHPMIEHFSAMRPTWLLFDADWMHTKQSAPYMKWCRKIVSVGRVKWIPDSKMTGKDNCAWYLFNQNSEGQTQFFGRVDA